MVYVKELLVIEVEEFLKAKCYLLKLFVLRRIEVYGESRLSNGGFVRDPIVRVQKKGCSASDNYREEKHPILFVDCEERWNHEGEDALFMLRNWCTSKENTADYYIEQSGKVGGEPLLWIAKSVERWVSDAVAWKDCRRRSSIHLPLHGSSSRWEETSMKIEHGSK
eukprot:Gb_20051 [translate_table: standard]